MALRYAKIEYPDVLTFLNAWEKQFKKGAVYLPAGTLEGEAAPELRLDLVVTGAGRVGPIPVQVIHRAPDGGIGVLIPEMPAAALEQVREITGFIEKITAYLVEKGEVIPADKVEGMIAARVQAALSEAAARAPQPTPAAPAPTSIPAAPGMPDLPMGLDAEPTFEGSTSSGGRRTRGLQLPDLRGKAPDYEGKLGDKSLRKAVMDLAVKRSTGIFTVKTPGGVTRYGFWSKGGPVGWRSEPVQQEEVLGVLLYRAGQVTKEQLQQSLNMMEKEGSRQGEAFIEMGVMSFAQLVMVLQKQCEYVFLKILDLPEGTWTFHTFETLTERFYNPAIQAPNLIYRRLSAEINEGNIQDIYEQLRPSLDRYVFMRKEVSEVMATIGWSKDERRFLELIQSRSWRLRELFSVSNMSRRNTARFFRSLLELEFVLFQEEEDVARYMNRITEEIITKKNRVMKVNYFDVLEVHWICLRPDVEEAYRQMKEHYNEKQYRDLSDELKKALVIINEKIEQAYQMLRDDKQRRAYRAENYEKDMILNSADLLAKKGEMAVMRADSRIALACWGRAVELIPNNAEYIDGFQRSKAIPTSGGQ